MDTARSNHSGPAPKKLVIGIGNEFRSDDGVGLVLARRLKADGFEGVEVREAGGEATGLIDIWKGAELAIVVDAVNSGNLPGTIFHFEVPGEPIQRALFSGHSTHALGLAEVIELSRTLDSLPKRLVIFGIEGANFKMGSSLSAPVESAARDVLSRIIDEIR